MARVAITVTDLVQGSGVVHGGGTVNTDLNHYIENGNLFPSILVVDNASGTTAGTITIPSGSNIFPAVRKGLGDVTLAVASGEVKYLAIESARHVQDENQIYVNPTGFDGGTKLAVIRVKS